MTSIAASKWSMSIHTSDRLSLKLKLNVQRYYYGLSLPIIAIQTLTLCGCVSAAPGIPSIYLAELQASSSPEGEESIRFSYFGLCTSTTPNSSLKCTPSILTQPTTTNTPLQNHVLSLQKSISFLTPCLASLFFLSGLLTLAILQFLLSRRKVPRKQVEKHVHHLTLATRILLWASAGVALAAANSVHITLSALGIAYEQDGKVGIRKGGTMQALLWTTFALMVVFNILMQYTTTNTSISTQQFLRARKSTPLPVGMTTIPPLRPLTLVRGGIVEESAHPPTATAAPIGMAIPLSPISLQQSDNGKRLLTPTTPTGNPLNPNFGKMNSPSLLSVQGQGQEKPPLATLGSRRGGGRRKIEVLIPSKEEGGQERLSPGLRSILKERGSGSGGALSIYARSPAPDSPRGGKKMWL